MKKSERWILDNIDSLRARVTNALDELRRELDIDDEAFSALLHAESLLIAWSAGVSLEDAVEGTRESYDKLAHLAKAPPPIVGEPIGKERQ